LWVLFQYFFTVWYPEEEKQKLFVSFLVYKNCAEVYKAGDKISGVYKIDPDGLGEFEVYCDQKTAGGRGRCFRSDGTAL